MSHEELAPWAGRRVPGLIGPRPMSPALPRGQYLVMNAIDVPATNEGERMKTPPVVSPEDWHAAREQLLIKEKELTRARDALAAERRRMPWVAVDKEYWFEGPAGRVSLAGLFEGRRQLIVYRAFYGSEVTTYAEGGSYPERACVGCSFGADQVAHPGHLHARDTSLAFVSRAPQAEIQRLKERHGWNHIPWYTITDDFDKDFDVDEWHGTNAFIHERDAIFRTYFINVRGDEQMGNTWNYLDITALGRQETWEDSPDGYPQTPPYQWWNYHDVHDTAK
jgi:predicted dithiol-disulfide oxidoreductase (DUF899 family)